MAIPGDDTDRLIADTEAWFLARGIPHFIQPYRASEDVFTRMLPALLLIFLVEMLGAASLEWSAVANVAALVAASALVVGIWAAVNRFRGRRWSQRPDDVGPVELALFVLVPALLPVVFGAQLGSAAVTAAVNLALLGIVYFVASYGLVPMTRWALVQTKAQVGTVLGLFGRALPLLLLFSVALFINTEVWQVAASLAGPLFWLAAGFIVMVGLAFLLLRLPAEVHHLAGMDLSTDGGEACAGTPLSSVADELCRSGQVEATALSRRQRGNLLLVLLFSQAVQVLLVTLTMSLFFLIFGVIAIRPEVISAWLGPLDPDVLARWTWFGYEMTVTRALVHTAGFLGILSGFYFTVYVITDATYRSEFFTEIIEDLHRSLVVRGVYLALLAR